MAKSEAEMVKINLRLPKSLLDEVDELYEERGYANRSEALRDAIRTWTNPPVRLSDEFEELLREGREQKQSDEYTTLDDLG
ncbi:MAG: ribbon-helix-helix domain-containing protein [Halobacteria archaeon]